ncbi:MAG: class I SAM-dependent methyltransferase [Gammaproteobacteria bacterium]|jgi:cyclopropane fatty-acyl-phospholipid synthase-like methyltransferase
MSKNKKRRISRAGTLHKHQLYEYSVQCPEAEVEFIENTFKRFRKRSARLLREDFCGTAAVCCEWVSRHPRNRAIGVDLDQDVLEWGTEHHLARLGKAQQRRVTLHNKNVLTVKTEKADAIAAMNFSYWLFKERDTLKRYFRRACKSLTDDGILFLDAYGGYEAFQEVTEEREIEEDGYRFTYVWEQESFNPVDNGLVCNIHFDFPDGTRMEQAFRYDWRLWTLPEIRDILAESGFRRVTTWWQGYDEDGESDGDFEIVTSADADAGWICYLVAEK